MDFQIWPDQKQYIFLSGLTTYHMFYHNQCHLINKKISIGESCHIISVYQYHPH